jgi:hypothetical protein
MGKRKFIFIFSCIFFLSACSTTNDNAETGSALLGTKNPSPIAVKKDEKDEKLVKDIKHTALSIDGIYDVAVIKGKGKDCLVGFKVHHLNRFRMKKIEKKLTERLEQKYQDLTFIVSSDYKIFLEAVRLNKKMREEHLTEEKMEKRLQQIIKLSREKT